MDIWREGKYVDLWTVNHFLSGAVFTGWMLWFGFGIWMIFVSYLILAIAWEIFESCNGVHERYGNKVMDVVTGVLGFLVVYMLIILGEPLGLPGVIAASLVFAAMEVHGYLAYKKRTASK